MTDDTEQYIRAAAKKRGLDPNYVVDVARQEGLGGNYSGDEGSSFGPFQLHYGGVASGGNAVAGLGDDFTRDTGLDARNSATVHQQIDYALDDVVKHGWGAFHGARRVRMEPDTKDADREFSQPDLDKLLSPATAGLDAAEGILRKQKGITDHLAEQYAETNRNIDKELADGASASAKFRKQLMDIRDVQAQINMPNPPDKKQDDPSKALSSTLGIFAVLASFAARRPAVAAMKAMAGILKGDAQKNQQDYENNLKEFNTKLQLAQFEMEKSNAEMTALLNDHKLDETERQARISAYAAAKQDATAIATMQERGLQGLETLQLERARLAEQLQMRADTYRNTQNNKWQILTDPNNRDSNGNMIQYRYNMATTEATTLDGKPYTPTGASKLGASTLNIPPGMLQGMIAQRVTGAPVSQIVGGWGGIEAKLQVNNGAVLQLQKENPGMTTEQAGAELAMRELEYQGGKRSVTQLTTMQGATIQLVKQLEYNIKKATEAMAKLPSTDLLPILNAIARQEQSWTGDPAYRELFYYISTASLENQRILMGAGASIAALAEGAAADAKVMVNQNVTPAQWVALSNAMVTEGSQRITNYGVAIDYMRQQLGGQARKDRPEQPAPATIPAPGSTIHYDENGKRIQSP